MIWVVTDHEQTRKSLAELIGAKGYAVQEVECGDDVTKRIRFRQPALIVLDCGIPNSFDLLQSIRKDARFGRLPVVMFSANNDGLRQRALLMGADAYVARGSLDWAELLTEVMHFAGPPESSQN